MNAMGNRGAETAAAGYYQPKLVFAQWLTYYRRALWRAGPVTFLPTARKVAKATRFAVSPAVLASGGRREIADGAQVCASGLDAATWTACRCAPRGESMGTPSSRCLIASRWGSDPDAASGLRFIAIVARVRYHDFDVLTAKSGTHVLFAQTLSVAATVATRLVLHRQRIRSRPQRRTALLYGTARRVAKRLPVYIEVDGQGRTYSTQFGDDRSLPRASWRDAPGASCMN